MCVGVALGCSGCTPAHPGAQLVARAAAPCRRSLLLLRAFLPAQGTHPTPTRTHPHPQEVPPPTPVAAPRTAEKIRFKESLASKAKPGADTSDLQIGALKNRRGACVVFGGFSVLWACFPRRGLGCGGMSPPPRGRGGTAPETPAPRALLAGVRRRFGASLRAALPPHARHPPPPASPLLGSAPALPQLRPPRGRDRRVHKRGPGPAGRGADDPDHAAGHAAEGAGREREERRGH